jgi:signal peptidase I
MPDEQPVSAAQPPPHFKPWVGVVLSFLVSGLGPFLAGKRRQGVAWFTSILVVGFLWSWIVGTAGVPVVLALCFLGGAGFVLWIVMLCKSYLPIPRFKKSLWLLFAGLFALISVGKGEIARQFTRPFQIPTGAMSPTLEGKRKAVDGSPKSPDHLFVSGCAYWFAKPQRGDVVVFRTDGIAGMDPSQYGQFYVKRIVGLPGDRISIQNGRLMNNGKPVEQPEALAVRQYVAGTKLQVGAPFLRDEGEVFEVPAGTYFVLGDNSTNSYDSRFFGPVPAQNLFGRATKIYWPLDRAGTIK